MKPQFDGLPTNSGLGPLPLIYNHLSFASYSILTPHDPALNGWISPNDLNCAVSAPNALLGSRPGGGNSFSRYPDKNSTHVPSGAYFFVGNATSMLEAGLQPYFTLLSFNLKPMDAPLPGTSISVRGYSHTRDDNNPFQWQVYFPAGYHLPFLVKMAEYSGEVWSELHGVEILADFGEQALDWEFCIDDLEVMFFAKPQGRDFESSQDFGQAVLMGF